MFHSTVSEAFDTVHARSARAQTRWRDWRSGAGPTRSRRLRLALPVFAAVAMSLALLGSILELNRRASSSRDAEISLDDITIDVNLLQNLPWKLASPEGDTAGQVTLQVATTEHAITQGLAGLQRRSRVPQVADVAPALQRDFGLLASELSLLRSGKVTPASALEPDRFHSQAAVLQTLGRADTAYRSEGARSMAEATLGSAAAVLLLLLGFGFFYQRALVARGKAEALADELRESEAHLEEAQRLAGVGSWEWEAASHIFVCSPQYARMHGWRDGQLPSTTDELFGIIDPEDRDRVKAELEGAVERCAGVTVDYRLSASAGGRLIHLEANVVRSADGGLSRLIGSCQDVTDRFRRAEAERANQAKNEFISRMSHELRTPLNAILGFAQLLTMAELDERHRRNVDRISTAGRHLLDLINEILDISRIESGRLRLSLEPVRVGPAINDAVDLVTPLASARTIEITTEVTNSIWVSADAQRLKQVLLNLLSNAVKYNRVGGRVMVITREYQDRSQIIVADDGPGIAPSMLADLFLPFERLGAEQTAIEGTGLGLSLSKGMVEAMGGSLTVQSKLGEGSAFTVELNTAVPPVIEVSVPGESPAESGAPRQRVLCIEDNPSNLTLIEQVFAMRPRVELLTAVQGTIGLELAREHHPRLILLDLNLPDVPGSEVLADLKSDPATKDIPVVVLSADATAGQFDRLVKAGASDFLTKPLDVRHVLAVVDETLAESVVEAA